jgi:hypothetical protein
MAFPNKKDMLAQISGFEAGFIEKMAEDKGGIPWWQLALAGLGTGAAGGAGYAALSNYLAPKAKKDEEEQQEASSALPENYGYADPSMYGYADPSMYGYADPSMYGYYEPETYGY